MYVVDSQLLQAFSGVPAGVPEPIFDSAPTYYDPLALTEAVPSWGDPMPGSLVVTVGFPATRSNLNARLEHVSMGTVLDDAQARDAIARLASLHDTEGMIAYDPEAEFLFEGHALPGMSGSGVFAEDGTQVGIVVRASFSDPDMQIVRAVRMRFVATIIDSAVDGLPAEARAEVARYLPPLQAPQP